jgi:hypothetical protein
VFQAPHTSPDEAPWINGVMHSVIFDVGEVQDDSSVAAAAARTMQVMNAVVIV